MAVLALPAVGGKFGVRGGGYSMSNSASWNIDAAVDRRARAGDASREHEPPRTRADRVRRSAGQRAVRLQLQPGGDDARSAARPPGLERDDLFTVVFEQVMTDTALYADVVLPATTFLEGYDFARAYGPINLELARPVIDAVGEARSNADVFGELCARLGLSEHGRGRGRARSDRAGARCAARHRRRRPARRHRGRCRRSASAPIQFVDVFPNTPDRKVDLFPAALEASAPMGLYRFQPDPGTDALPAGAHLAGERSDDQLDARRAAAARRAS